MPYVLFPSLDRFEEEKGGERVVDRVSGLEQVVRFGPVPTPYPPLTTLIFLVHNPINSIQYFMLSSRDGLVY